MKTIGVILVALLALAILQPRFFQKATDSGQAGLTSKREQHAAPALLHANPANGANNKIVPDWKSRQSSTGIATTSQYFQNHQELWAILDASEYALVSEFSARYSEALEFYNHDQLLWMQRHGYPMPADILAAAQLTDDQLRKLADSGNSPATAILLDRLISQAARLGRELLAQGDDPFANTDFFPIMRDLMEYQKLLSSSGTPFAGYIDARAQMEVFGLKTAQTDYGKIVEIALRGLAFAHGRGDQLARNRALWLADEAGIDPAIFDHYVSYGSYQSSIQDLMCGD